MSEIKDGDDVTVTLEGSTYEGQALQRYIGGYPDSRERLFIYIPLRGRYTIPELEQFGATIEQSNLEAKGRQGRWGQIIQSSTGRKR